MFAETLHPKRRRTTNPKVWEVESEQEEHSLSLSQHSSPSQSDQEQTPVRKVSDSVTSSQGLRLLKHVNHSSTSEPYSISRTQPEFRNTVQSALQQDLPHFGHQNQLKTEQPHILHAVRPVKEHKPLETGLIQNLVAKLNSWKHISPQATVQLYTSFSLFNPSVIVFVSDWIGCSRKSRRGLRLWLPDDCYSQWESIQRCPVHTCKRPENSNFLLPLFN